MLILVTGASGLLGANFVLGARESGARVIAAYHCFRLSIPGVTCVRLDLMDGSAIKDLIARTRPDWIVHCAALTNVDWCEENPDRTYLLNSEASRELAASARRAGAKLVYISTDAVFDGKHGNYCESDTPAPLNVYAWSKLRGERQVQSELPSSMIVRTNIYGWNMQPKRSLAEWMLDRLESGQDILGFEDVVFTPILVNDLSRIILDMMAQDLAGVFHVAGSQATSKYQFALLLARVFSAGRAGIRPISVGDSLLKARRPKNTTLDTGKASGALGRNMPDVRSGLERFRELREAGQVDEMRSYGGGARHATHEDRQA